MGNAKKRSTTRQRWVIEGEWSGYTASQRKVAHREVTTNRRRAESLSAQRSIQFDDGTTLFISVRELGKGERVEPVFGYSALIADCLQYGVWSVAEVQNAKDGVTV